jgi:hypothetical protein
MPGPVSLRLVSFLAPRHPWHVSSAFISLVTLSCLSCHDQCYSHWHIPVSEPANFRLEMCCRHLGYLILCVTVFRHALAQCDARRPNAVRSYPSKHKAGRRTGLGLRVSALLLLW